MKKLRLILIMFFLSALMIVPSFSIMAEESREIFYPVGISDYVDLNGISNFAVSDSKIFYTKDNTTVVCYDKVSKQSHQLTTTGTVYNICVEGDYVFVFTSASEGTFAFDVDTLTSVTFNYAPKSLNKAVSANYKDGKYYFAYIVVSQNPSFEIKVYDNLESQPVAAYQYTQNIKQTYSDSIIAFSESLIVLKPITGNEIFLFNYPTSSLNPALEGNNTVMNLTSYSSINSMEVIQAAENNYIFIGTNSETIICTFNGASLTYNTNSEVLNIMKTYNNNLYGYKSNSANVSKYDYNDNTKTFDNVTMFLAGKGGEAGRFKDVTSLTYKSNIMYVTDSGNNRIQVISDNDITTLNFTGKCTEIIVDNNNNYYYVVQSGSNSILYKNNNTYVATYSGKKIVSIDMGIDNTLYMLTLDGQILSYGVSATTPITLDFAVNANSKLRLNHTLSFANKSEMITTNSVAISAKIAVSVDKNIYEVNKSSGVISDTITFDSNVKDFKFNDAYIGNPVFVLLNNGSFVRSSFEESQDRDIVLENFNDHTCFDLDNITGEIKIYNNSLSAIELYNNRTFSPITSMPHYYENLTTPTGANVIWKYGEVKANTFVYDYYYYSGNYNKLGSNTDVIIIEANEEFAYIGYNLNNTLTYGYVERTSLIQSNGKDVQEMAIVETDTPIKLRTTNKNVSVFKYPSIYNNTTIYTFAQGDIITTLGKYTTSIDGLNYYVVKIGNGYGYICSNNVVLSENISRSIKTNAKIKIFDGQEKINVYLTAEDGSSILCQLPEAYKINVVNYDKNQKYTHITFIDEDQQEREGYILTSYVKMDGISSTVITAIVLLVLDIIIAIIVIVFYRHYKKKQKENSIKK